MVQNTELKFLEVVQGKCVEFKLTYISFHSETLATVFLHF